MIEDAGQIARDGEILRGVVGSTAHGTAVDGQDDRDEMGIFIEPPEKVCGLRALEHWIYRDKPTGVRSEPGDLDLTLYSLRKFCRLAVGGNPSVIMLLWLPKYKVLMDSGWQLLGIREAFRSRTAGKAFLGYLKSQKMALNGERSKKTSRPDLVERYGYDTKFAMHALRLGYQGIEYIRDGRITLPVPEPQLSVLRSVRTGEMDFVMALRLIEESEDELLTIMQNFNLTVDRDLVDKFLVEAHRKHWG